MHCSRNEGAISEPAALARSHTDNLLIRLGTARSVAANFSTGGLEKNYLHVVAIDLAARPKLPCLAPLPFPTPPRRSSPRQARGRPRRVAFFAFSIEYKDKKNKKKKKQKEGNRKTIPRKLTIDLRRLDRKSHHAAGARAPANSPRPSAPSPLGGYE